MIGNALKTKLKRRLGILLLILCSLGFTGCGAQERQEQPITSLEELNGRTVSVQSGTVYAAQLKENEQTQNVEILYAPTSTDCLVMLLSGKADAYITDDAAAQILLEQYGNLAVLEEPLDRAGYGLAFQKGDPLRDQFSAVIRRMKKDGSLETMTRKWLDGDAAEKTVPAQTWPGKNGTIDCQVSPDTEPICYPIGTDVTGFDVDLILTIAQELDYRVTFTANQYYDILPQLAAGHTNMVASAVTVTPERAEIVDFTEEYMDAVTVVVVRSGENESRQGILRSIRSSLQRVFVENEHWKDLLLGLGRTVLLIIMTAVSALIFGAALFLWGYTESRVSRRVLAAADWIMTMLPTSTWLMIMYYIVFAGKGKSAFIAAAVAFTVYLGVNMYGTLRSNVEALPAGQAEAASSMGYSRFKALRLILLPQALPGFCSDMEGIMTTHVKDTSLVGMITVWDIQAVADVIRAETLDPFLTLVLTAVIYMLLAWGSSALIHRIRISRLFSEKSEEQIRERLKKGKL